ncbi:MAG: FecCD family ABC transporter permease [Candidatus Methanomethylophilaceae archaeon]
MSYTSNSIVATGKRRLAYLVILGLVGLTTLFLASISFGPVPMTLGEVWQSITNIVVSGPSSGDERIIFYLRLPRVLGAFTVGIGLSVAGVVFQAIIRNPLVDPYMTGVSSGSGFGATIAMILAVGTLSTYSLVIVPIGAFIGGLVAFSFTFLVAKGAGGRSIHFVLAGVITGMAFSSITTMIMMVDDEKTHSILSFLFGSFTTVGWNNLWIMVIPVASLVIIIFLKAREFNVILLGEEQAKQLGLDVNRFNLSMLIVASLLTAVCVAFVGVIAFIGLVVPHLARMIVGGDHRLLLPASVMIGAITMAAADLVAKLAFAPVELPVGAIMTLIGVPFFAYLLLKRGKDYAA